jgi:hypothetical protein
VRVHRGHLRLAPLLEVRVNWRAPAPAVLVLAVVLAVYATHTLHTIESLRSLGSLHSSHGEALRPQHEAGGAESVSRHAAHAAVPVVETASGGMDICGRAAASARAHPGGLLAAWQSGGERSETCAVVAVQPQGRGDQPNSLAVVVQMRILETGTSFAYSSPARSGRSPPPLSRRLALLQVSRR